VLTWKQASKCLSCLDKIRNDPNGILRGPGDTDLRKKPEVENLVSDFLGYKVYVAGKFHLSGYSEADPPSETGQISAKNGQVRQPDNLRRNFQALFFSELGDLAHYFCRFQPVKLM
jgi:hypothetical protein